MIRAWVLYEDSRAPGGKEYGPHLFVLACVADRLSQDLYELRRDLRAIPLNGFGNVGKQLRRPDHLRDGGASVFALVDGDRAHRDLKLPFGATDDDIRRGMLGESPPEAVQVFVLRDNTETLLTAVAGALGRSWETSRKPTPVERDRLLLRAATIATPDERARVVGAVRGLDGLIDALVDLCTRER